jgi:hypothetical protein
MSIILEQADSDLGNAIICSICGISLALNKATAGLLNAQGEQAYACVSHLSEFDLFIRGWADFIANQKTSRGSKERGLEELYGGKRYSAWLNP